jgi:hypothetical protein
MFPPSRIVYLTEEIVETLCLASRTASSGSPAMSCARLKHSLTAPAYPSNAPLWRRSFGLGRKSTPAVASAPATGEPGAKEQVETRHKSMRACRSSWP